MIYKRINRVTDKKSWNVLSFIEDGLNHLESKIYTILTIASLSI